VHVQCLAVLFIFVLAFVVAKYCHFERNKEIGDVENSAALLHPTRFYLQEAVSYVGRNRLGGEKACLRRHGSRRVQHRSQGDCDEQTVQCLTVSQCLTYLSAHQAVVCLMIRAPLAMYSVTQILNKCVLSLYCIYFAILFCKNRSICQLMCTMHKSAKALKLSFEYIHIYSQKVVIFAEKNSKIASLMSYQRSDLRKTLKYSQSSTPCLIFEYSTVKVRRRPCNTLIRRLRTVGNVAKSIFVWSRGHA